MKYSLQEEIQLLPRQKAADMKEDDLVLVVAAYGEPVAMTIPDMVRGAIRIANKKNAKRQKARPSH